MHCKWRWTICESFYCRNWITYERKLEKSKWHADLHARINANFLIGIGLNLSKNIFMFVWNEMSMQSNIFHGACIFRHKHIRKFKSDLYQPWAWIPLALIYSGLTVIGSPMRLNSSSTGRIIRCIPFPCIKFNGRPSIKTDSTHPMRKFSLEIFTQTFFNLFLRISETLLEKMLFFSSNSCTKCLCRLRKWLIKFGEWWPFISG